MANRAQWAESLAVGLHEWIDDAYKQVTPTYPLVFNVMTSDRAYEEDVTSTGLSKLAETQEGGPTQYEDPLFGFKTRYTHAGFKKGVKITKELFDDDQYRLFNDLATKLGRAAARTLDFEAFSVFRNGFTAANISYGDNKPLFSVTHTRADGGTAFSNASATSIPLNELNLNTGILDLRNQRDDRGELTAQADGKLLLLVPLALEKLAVEITQSQLKQDTANNDLNYYQGRIDVLATRWIGATVASGSDKAWYLLVPEMHRLNIFMREPFATSDDYEFDADILKVKGRMRFSFGWSDYRSTWGSQGDGSAYAL